jgi:hypothetical protein
LHNQPGDQQVGGADLHHVATLEFFEQAHRILP